MNTKKNDTRFTIQFNTVNERHKAATQMLNEAGRYKAGLIADALHVYRSVGAVGNITLLEGKTENPVPFLPPMTEAAPQTTEHTNELLEAVNNSMDSFFGG